LFTLVLAFLTLISFIGLVFVPPAEMFFVAAGRVRGHGTSLARSIATVLVALLGGTGAFFALFVQEDPVCWARNPATGRDVPIGRQQVRSWLVDLDEQPRPSGRHDGVGMLERHDLTS
jgi:hypothetical protein